MKTAKRNRKWIGKQRAKKYLRWAEKAMAPYKEQYDKVNEQLFKDILYAGTAMVHVSDTDMRVIEPYSTEYWNIKDRIEYNKHIEKYGYPPPSSTQVSIMTIEEIKEKYGTK